MAGIALVQILNMHHFESGLVHFMLRVEIRVCRQAGGCHFAHNRRMRKPSAPGIGEDVDLNLSHTARKLVRKRSMMIVEAPQCLGILHLHVLSLAGRKPLVVAVVRSDHLDLVHTHNLILCRLCGMLRHCRVANREPDHASDNLYCISQGHLHLESDFSSRQEEHLSMKNVHVKLIFGCYV